MAVSIQPVPVWSGRLRLVHWVMALAVLVLSVSGWLLPYLAPQASLLRDLHYIAGYALLLTLLARFYLLFFGRAAEHWRDLVPRGPQVRAAWHTALFYLSLGRAPLPAWYAHNPLWSPVYLFWWLLLWFQVWTGLFPVAAARVGLDATRWHGAVAHLIAILVIAHVAAVFLHDLKGRSADVSGMINGLRWFRIDKPDSPLASRSVSLDNLLRSKSKTKS